MKDIIRKFAVDINTNNIPNKDVDPNVIVTNVLNMAYAFGGLIAVGFIIYGGIMYTTSAGDPAKVKKASQTLLYASIGLLVVLLAAAITNFVLGATA
ncbi:hypothetical protein IJF86_00015 [Candidatus Saccharibacteria bacterium]|nr:hypothetical protein [Candidatus Saccharibacteria bacterium]